MPVELKVPEVGESITEVEIGRWLKDQGQPVEKDEPLVEIETDKVTVELPAPANGTISKRLKLQGEAAKVGEVIGYVETAAVSAEAEEAAETTAPASISAPQHSASVAQTTTQQPAPADDAHIMPAARRLLQQYSLRSEDIHATGPGGRLLKEDVEQHLEKRRGQAQPHEQPETRKAQESLSRETTAQPEQTAAPEPEAPEPPAGMGVAEREEEIVPMTPLRRRIAQRLVEAQQNAAMLTTFNEIDMTAVMDLRNRYKDDFDKRYGIRLGFMSFFVKATVDALKQFPAVNAEIRDDKIAYKNYYDIGIAVSTERGLLVPVLRSAERMSFADIELAIADFAKRAQSNKIQLEELQGGTFTITNGGVFGSLLSTPILNPPQSGVLGMHAIQKRPVAVGDEIKIRPMMYVALTYDHRIIDGREAVTFLRRIKEACEDPSRMLMEI